MKFVKAWIFGVTLLVTATATAKAEVSGNIGWASDYYYRGIFQAHSSASVGVDFETNGFYVGSWAADVGDGLEVDGYLGYQGEVGDLSYGVGVTGYYYTQNFDDTYEEVNLGVGYGIVSLDLAFGRYENFTEAEQYYSYYALSVSKQGFYGKIAGFGKDFAGEYLEFGYSTSVAEIDVGLSVILANADLVGASDESLVFTIGKTFDF